MFGGVFSPTLLNTGVFGEPGDTTTLPLSVVSFSFKSLLFGSDSWSVFFNPSPSLFVFSTESSLVSNGFPFLSFPFSCVTFNLLGLESVAIVLTVEIELGMVLTVEIELERVMTVEMGPESVLAVETELESVLAVEMELVEDGGCDCDREL